MSPAWLRICSQAITCVLQRERWWQSKDENCVERHLTGIVAAFLPERRASACVFMLFSGAQTCGLFSCGCSLFVWFHFPEHHEQQ